MPQRDREKANRRLKEARATCSAFGQRKSVTNTIRILWTTALQAHDNNPYLSRFE